MSDAYEIKVDNRTFTVSKIADSGSVALAVAVCDQPSTTTFMTKEQAQTLGAALLDAAPINPTRRERFAAAALQGLIAQPNYDVTDFANIDGAGHTNMAREAVKFADALIFALDEKPTNT